MPSVLPPPNSTALLILQQAQSLSAVTEPQRSAGDRLIATANGVANPETAGAGRRSSRARISEALFNAAVPDAHQTKINLMRRLGEEFGVSFDDFETAAAFGAAVRDIIGQIKLQEGGLQHLKAIETKLGLDKLGLSLDALVNAIVDPEGSDGERLEAALKRQIGEGSDERRKNDVRGIVFQPSFSDGGLYGV